MNRLLAALLALVLVAAACGDDSSSDEADGDTTTSAAPDDGATDDDGETDDGTTDDGTTDDEPPAVELFDSHQGVTATDITFGVAAIDAEALIPFGFDLGVTPVEQMYEAWSEAQNARGGVLGRNLIPHTRLYLPVGNEQADAVCAEFAEDVEVFAVTGQLFGDSPLCVTELYGLPYIGHFGLNDSRDAASEGRFIATEMANSAQRYGGVAEMIAQGDLDGKKVALWWDGTVDVEFADLVRPLLVDAGVEIVVEVEVGDFGQDQLAADAAADQRMERVISEGADLIIGLSNITPVTEAADRARYEGEIAFTNGQAADQNVFPEADISEGSTVPERTFAITTSKPTPQEALADPGVQQCIDEYTAVNDEPIDLESTTVIQAFTNHCRAFRLMVMIFEAAGADLNPASFVTAAEGLGTFDLPAMANAYLGPDDHAAGSLIQRYEYDPELGFHVPVGEPIQPATPEDS